MPFSRSSRSNEIPQNQRNSKRRAKIYLWPGTYNFARTGAGDSHANSRSQFNPDRKRARGALVHWGRIMSPRERKIKRRSTGSRATVAPLLPTLIASDWCRNEPHLRPRVNPRNRASLAAMRILCEFRLANSPVFPYCGMDVGHGNTELEFVE